MIPTSTGLVLYYIENEKIYYVLGLEGGNWYPFKGRVEAGETEIEGACREVKEETRGLVSVEPKDFEGFKVFLTTSNKRYRYGLHRVSKDLCDKFNKLPVNSYEEKLSMRAYTLEDADMHNLPNVTTRTMRKAETAIKSMGRTVGRIARTKKVKRVTGRKGASRYDDFYKARCK